jgi:Xaa-Pro aminopeptidase
MTDRFDPYRQVARRLGSDAVALVPGPNFERLLGRPFSTSERPHVVVIPVSGEPAAIVPALELRSWDLVGFEGATIAWRDQDGYDAAFMELFRKLPLSSMAVEGQEMRVFVHHALKQAQPDLGIVDGEVAISGLRTIKTPAEIARLKEAIGISERALAQLVDQVRIGQTEKDVEQFLTLALFREGAEAHAFGPLVGAGDGSARPHTKARADYRIAAGDALLIDFGARKSGFVADITRTFFVGHATDEAQAVYETVLRANRTGVHAAKAGMQAGELDDIVTKVLEASAFADRIRTRTGHGIGREVHEAPYLVRGNSEILEAGMVCTIEPGLYRIGGFGVRIEDDIHITEQGCEVLTSFPRELLVIGRA